jgi:mono/diheme cytochrome c family protein/glucose/arabinose dehydrogenase
VAALDREVTARGAALVLAVALAGGARAQRGDQPGEPQPPLPDALRMPPPRALSAEEELATFRFPSDVRVELVAGEPLVRDPVCASFDERGRLFVCEMSGYMRDADGTREDERVGAVALLTDVDGDGRMDRRTTFLGELVLPRAVAPTRGGALVIAPPNLLFARDTDDDGVADDVRTLDTGLAGVASPEHAVNGLLFSIDNWFWCANAPIRYRWNGDRLERGRTAGGGQWGISADARGRIYFNDNSNPLRCDLYPSHLAVRNPNLGVAPGMGVSIAGGARPHPIHATPGVNRGYRAGVLAEGRLNEFTGACAPWIYEGDLLPEGYRGDAFVCEPCGNLVHRFEISDDEGGWPKATTAPPDGAFLASTDERFRPVWLTEGPDGALYVVDMYRGVIQHKLFVTSWLRAQIEERGLEQPVGRGRIWRVTSGERKKPPADLAACSWTELAARLDSPNRWLRITAQRLFVEQGDAVAAEVLREHVAKSESESGRLHAGWALHGLGAAGASARLAHHPEPFTVLDLSSELGWSALLAMAPRCARDEVERGALISALAGRELEFAEALAAREEWCEFDEPFRAALLAALAACIVSEGTPERVDRLAHLVFDGSVSQRAMPLRNALARGALDARAKDAEGKPRPIVLERRPDGLDLMQRRQSDDATIAELIDALVWPGKPGSEGLIPRGLTQDERERFERGRDLFEQACAGCHGYSGRGDSGVAPPLRDSPWVLGPPERLARVLLHGLRGPVTIDGKTWDGEMPAFVGSDREIAALSTYLRRAWNHGADPVEDELVRAVRERSKERTRPWAVEEVW